MLVFTPDGKSLLTVHSVRGLVLWDAETGDRMHRVLPVLTPEEQRQARLRYAPAISPAISPDGRLVAVENKDGGITIHETAGGAARRVLPSDQQRLSALAFSPDGRVLASASSDSTVLLWDLAAPLPGEQAPTGEPTDKDLAGLWSDLASEDGARVERAVLRLRAAPEQAVPLVRKNLQAAEVPSEEKLARLIADLDSSSFKTRKAAGAELARLGTRAKAALERALKGKPSLDVRKRLEDLLQQLEDKPLAPEQLRLLRGVEVLERIGSPGARQALEELARGPKYHPVTEDARAALARLDRPARR